MSKCHYTILYPFFHQRLGLRGYTKEVFAVIFGFWYASNQTSVPVSISVIQEIVGGERCSLIKAIKELEERGLVVATRTPGRETKYSVKLDHGLLNDFRQNYTKTEPVSLQYQHRFCGNTGAGIAATHNNNIQDFEIDIERFKKHDI